MFESTDEGLDFMEELGLDEIRGLVLERLGRNFDASELYISEGRPEKAIQVLLLDLKDVRCLEKATQMHLQQLWRRYAFAHRLGFVKSCDDYYEPLAKALIGKLSAEDSKEVRFVLFFIDEVELNLWITG